MKKNLITLLIASILVISSIAFGVTVLLGATYETAPMGGIRVTKYNDLNMNEWWDRSSEDSLEGWTIEVYEEVDDEWVYMDEQVTDEYGEVYWHDLTPGTYMLKEIMQDHWMSTTGETRVIQVIGDQYVCHNFGNIQTGSICTYKFHDDNMNGEWDDGEEPVSGWEFELWRDESVWYTEETDQKGQVCFHDVPIGNYTVREELPDGWLNTTPMEFEAVVEHCEVTEVGPFGNVQYGSLRVCKFYDEDMDGEWGDEEGLMDWEILVYDETGTELEYRGFTECGGCVVFEDILPGTYVVTEVIPDGWFNTTADEFTVEVNPGEETEVHFGNIEYGEITIYKFNDLNMDGVYDE
ncbi:MAG: MSCRAMM family protein, partial [Candidatus Saliniplasma sp.]